MSSLLGLVVGDGPKSGGKSEFTDRTRGALTSEDPKITGLREATAAAENCSKDVQSRCDCRKVARLDTQSSCGYGPDHVLTGNDGIDICGIGELGEKLIVGRRPVVDTRISVAHRQSSWLF